MQKIMIAQEIQKQAGGIEITDQGLHHRRVGFPQRPEDRRDILSLQRGIRWGQLAKTLPIALAFLPLFRCRQSTSMGPDRHRGAFTDAGFQ